MAGSEIHLGELESSVTAVDGDSLLSPQTLRRIVAAVMREVEAREEHRRRVRAELRIARGMGDEAREEWG